MQGEIIQIGEMLWQLVKANEAVVDYSQDWAGAVPADYDSNWISLGGWVDVASEEFRFHYKVGGDTVSELKWKYYWSAEGHNVDGGHYVQNAGAHIERLYARVGQEIEAKVTAVQPINYGTPEDPIGGIDITVTFTSAGSFGSETLSCTATLRGDKEMVVKDCTGNDP